MRTHFKFFCTTKQMLLLAEAKASLKPDEEFKILFSHAKNTSHEILVEIFCNPFDLIQFGKHLQIHENASIMRKELENV